MSAEAIPTIRPAVESDVETICELIRALARYEKLSHEAAPDAARLRAHLFGAARYAEVLLAFWEGASAGFALFFHNYSTFLTRPGLYLEDLFVREELRRNGIGTALFRGVARLAVERGCGRMEWAVLDWNEPALAFYRSLGAVAMSDWTIHRLTGDALIAAGGGKS